MSLFKLKPIHRFFISPHLLRCVSPVYSALDFLAGTRPARLAGEGARLPLCCCWLLEFLLRVWVLNSGLGVGLGKLLSRDRARGQKPLMVTARPGSV
jgi:hypothetical protein